MKRYVCIPIVICLAGVLQAATFRPFSSLPNSVVSGFTIGRTIEPIKVSDDGTTLFGTGRREGGVDRHGFIWTKQLGLQILESPNLPEGSIRLAVVGDVADNVIVGTARFPSNSGSVSPATWYDGEWHEIDLSDIGQGFGGSAGFVSADGQRIVGNPPFLWTRDEGARYITEGNGGHIGGATPDLDVLVGSLSDLNGDIRAFYWTETKGISLLPGTQIDATDVSDDGRVIVGRGRSPWYWTQEGGSVSILEPDEGFETTDVLVSGNGEVIAREFYWTAAAGTRPLRDALIADFAVSENALAGWAKITATDINHDGSVMTGFGFAPDGELSYWVAQLKPDDNWLPEGRFLTGAPVSDVNVTDNVLVNFEADGRHYEQQDLIPAQLVSFANDNPPQAGIQGIIVVPDGGEIPQAGHRAELLTTDFRLDTGVLSPAIGTDSMSLEFNTPLVNGPGPDLVFFEFDFKRYGDLADPFQLSVEGNRVVVIESSWGDSRYTLDGDVLTALGDVRSLEDLETMEFSNFGRFQHPVFGTAIDLSELGVEPFDSVSRIDLGSYGAGLIDLVLAMGIDSGKFVNFGDFDESGSLDVHDVDLLIQDITQQRNSVEYDLNGDRVTDQKDLTIWVHKIKSTYFGDANLDGEFNSQDFVSVFLDGLYEDGIPENATWGTGDWNGDGDFTSQDMVAAFLDGGYEQGPRPTSAVPEPSALCLLLTAGLLLICGRRLIL